MQKFNLIFLRSDKVLVSQKQYSDWKEIQNEFDDYMANVGFDSIDEIKEYIQFDYKLTEEKALKESRKISDSNSEYVEIEL
jgi:hypothetical protein